MSLTSGNLQRYIVKFSKQTSILSPRPELKVELTGRIKRVYEFIRRPKLKTREKL